MHENRYSFFAFALFGEQKETLGFCNIAHLKADQTQIHEGSLKTGKRIERLLIILPCPLVITYFCVACPEIVKHMVIIRMGSIGAFEIGYGCIKATHRTKAQKRKYVKLISSNYLSIEFTGQWFGIRLIRKSSTGQQGISSTISFSVPRYNNNTLASG